MSLATGQRPKRVGRYFLFEKIASGGMATVHYGLVLGDEGFSRVVAIKRVRPDKRATDGYLDSLLDEARLASRVKHPNVVPPLDVFWHDGELLMVLEYVAGESLSSLLRSMQQRGETIPLRIGATIVAQVLHGLHAAHNAKSAAGKPLGIVHRDVSPQNILVGRDGLARILDFGIAKAAERVAKSVEGQVKGKLAYLSPEQLKGASDRRTDVYTTGIVFWEVLAQQRLFQAKTTMEMFEKIVERSIDVPSVHRDEISPELDAVVMKALSVAPEDRFPTARAFALAIEECVGMVSSAQVGDWIEKVAGPSLAAKAELIADLERRGSTAGLTSDPPPTDGATTRRLTPLPASTVPHALPTEVTTTSPAGPDTAVIDAPTGSALDDMATTVALEDEDSATRLSHEPDPATQLSVQAEPPLRTSREVVDEKTHLAAAEDEGTLVDDPTTMASSDPASDPASKPTSDTASRSLTDLAPASDPTSDPASDPTSDTASRSSTDLAPASADEAGDPAPSSATRASSTERRSGRWLVAVVLALLGGAVAWVMTGGLGASGEASTSSGRAPASGAAPPAPSSPAADRSVPSPSAAAPSSSAQPSSQPSVQPSSTAPPASAPPPAPAPPPAWPAPPPPPPADCTPPYTVDERGIRRLKPHCL